MKEYKVMIGDDTTIVFHPEYREITRKKNSKKTWDNVIYSKFAFDIVFNGENYPKDNDFIFEMPYVSRDLLCLHDALYECLLCNHHSEWKNPIPVTLDWTLSKHTEGSVCTFDLTFFRSIGAGIGYKLPPLLLEDIKNLERVLREYIDDGLMESTQLDK